MRWFWRISLVLLFGIVEANADNGKACRQADLYESYVLAMNWQPGFCEHVQGNSHKPECRDMASSTLNIDHLPLHSA
ncbi:MAG: hypothetical protein PHI97_15685 [Desulfobulbus sp.]|nr:hypothetical protein [Desulfobulbus sp.]